VAQAGCLCRLEAYTTNFHILNENTIAFLSQMRYRYLGFREQEMQIIVTKLSQSKIPNGIINTLLIERKN
jgi:hypothetical protein